MTAGRGYAAVDLAPDEGTPEVQSVLGGHIWVIFLPDEHAPEDPPHADGAAEPAPAPDTVICRHLTSGTTATGFDGLSARLLERAGFQREHHFTHSYYRLRYDQGEAKENAQATDAARMLRAAHYTVSLDPGLDLDADSVARAAGWTCPVHPDAPNR
jgi:hypothetical protein